MKNTGNTDSLDKGLIGFKILKKESNYMKKVIILIVLAMATIRCTELAELNDEEERIRNERGAECRYNKRGGVENCRYMD